MDTIHISEKDDCPKSLLEGLSLCSTFCKFGDAYLLAAMEWVTIVWVLLQAFPLICRPYQAVFGYLNYCMIDTSNHNISGK